MRIEMSNILVVGGAGGVGSAVVDVLVSRGDTVAVTVLNADEAGRVTAAHGDKVATYEVDLGDAEKALGQIQAAVSAMGSLDSVAVCAAIAPIGPVETTSLATFRKTLEINVVASVAIYQAALPALRKSKGRIVYVSSMAGRTGMPFIGAYTASKYGLEGVGDVMRREAAPQGIKISLVEPGGIRTPMVEQQLASVQQSIATLDAEQNDRYGYLYRGFLKAAGESHVTTSSTPEQVAAVVLEALDAAEPEARYIAGDDAKGLIGLADSISDKELDGVFGQMFTPEPAPAE
jgi:NAD(P)-dependent dehydrogenase (short-subunit alcohol dehydrogenase family)